MTEPLDMAEVRAAAQAQSDMEPVGASAPVYEVKVTRLVTFIVSIEELRKDQFDPDLPFDPQQAAEDFIDDMEGADIDNYATIHTIELPPRRVSPPPGSLAAEAEDDDA